MSTFDKRQRESTLAFSYGSTWVPELLTPPGRRASSCMVQAVFVHVRGAIATARSIPEGFVEKS